MARARRARLIAAGFLRKIVIEERFMQAEFGEAYDIIAPRYRRSFHSSCDS